MLNSAARKSILVLITGVKPLAGRIAVLITGVKVRSALLINFLHLFGYIYGLCHSCVFFPVLIYYLLCLLAVFFFAFEGIKSPQQKKTKKTAKTKGPKYPPFLVGGGAVRKHQSQQQHMTMLPGQAAPLFFLYCLK